jgi:hypothetical protein
MRMIAMPGEVSSRMADGSPPPNLFPVVSAWWQSVDDVEALDSGFDWATRFGARLRVVAGNLDAADRPARLAAVDALKRRCAGRGVNLELVFWQGTPTFGARQFLQTAGLCIAPPGLPEPVRRPIIAEWLGAPHVGLLLGRWQAEPPERVLVVDADGRRPEYLHGVAGVCRALAVCPIVVVVAGSEAQAAARQRTVEAVFAGARLDAEFDIVVGRDAPGAVRRVARWRGCSLVIVERRAPSIWPRWPRGDLLDRMRDDPEAPAVLTLPYSPQEGTALPH